MKTENFETIDLLEKEPFTAMSDPEPDEENDDLVDEDIDEDDDLEDEDADIEDPADEELNEQPLLEDDDE